VPNIKLYDYQRVHHPRVKWTTSYPMPIKNSDSLRSNVPWVDNHMLCCYFDDKEKLIGVRFVYQDGKYVDLIEVTDGY
jgi:hypothetical protein